MPEKKHENLQKNKNAYKNIKNALRFGRLFLFVFPFQQGDDEVPAVSFWGWFGL